MKKDKIALNRFYGVFGGDNFFYNLTKNIDDVRRAEKKKSMGFSDINGLEGSDKLNIPHKYEMIDIRLTYIVCILADGFYEETEGGYDIYSIDGKFLFNTNNFEYLKEGMFLVEETNKKKQDKEEKIYYSLYNQDTKVSDYMFRPINMSTFNKEGYCVIGGKDFATYFVINKIGEIKHTSGVLEHPYVFGVICVGKNIYTNLITGEVICKGYSTSLQTNDFIFVKVDENTVYQINKTTGEYTVHGEAKK